MNSQRGTSLIEVLVTMVILLSVCSGQPDCRRACNWPTWSPISEHKHWFSWMTLRAGSPPTGPTRGLCHPNPLGTGNACPIPASPVTLHSPIPHNGVMPC